MIAYTAVALGILLVVKSPMMKDEKRSCLMGGIGLILLLVGIYYIRM